MAQHSKNRFVVFSFVQIFIFLHGVDPSLCVGPEEDKELVIFAMGPFQDSQTGRSPNWDGGPALIPAARLAVDHINNRSDILQGYTLNLLEGESGCDLIYKTFINFTAQVFYHPKRQRIVGMVGPGCSDSAIILEKLISQPQINLLQISIANTPSIDSTHVNSFRTVGSGLVFIDAYLKLIDIAKWERVGVLYDEEREFHTSIYNAFIDQLGDKLAFSLPLKFYSFVNINEIKVLGIRVIFVFAGRNLSRNVRCLTYKADLRFRRVQFLFIERVSEDFIGPVYVLSPKVTCSVEEMKDAMNGVILITNPPQRNDTESNNTAARISYVEYESMYQTYLDSYLAQPHISKSYAERDLPATVSRYFSGYYDAVWALALALNKSVEYGSNQTIAQIVTNDLRANLLNLSFEGMSGLITFDGERKDVPTIGVSLSQFTTDKNTTVTGFFVTGTLTFDGDFIDHDFERETYRIPLELGITMIAVAITLSIPLMLLQLAFCKYSNVKAIKATSPQLNHLILSGCYLFIVVILSKTILETFPSFLAQNSGIPYRITCSSIYWSTALAFTLVFGTISSKTWRIYKIFGHFKQRRVGCVSDEHLVLFVTVLIVIDVVLLTAWNSIDLWQLHITPKRDGIHLIEHYTCRCNRFTTWLPVLLYTKECRQYSQYSSL